MNHVPPKLKAVSKVKHQILEKYFPAWAKILGSANTALVYVDCFAGSGQYAEGEEGSPLLILRKAREIVKDSNNYFSIIAIFVEKDSQATEALRSRIPTDLPTTVQAHVFNEDAHDFVPELLKTLPEGMPAFFFIDPYGHPLSIPVMNKILSLPKKEILLTLMWYSINMHLNNPMTKEAITRMFGDDKWKNQLFMETHGLKREIAFIKYFLSRLEVEYKLCFRIRFSPEDQVPAREKRTKYYLIHLSNHPKAVLLMKEVMWPLGDDLGTFDYSAMTQRRLFLETPNVQELIKFLQDNYGGQSITFDELRRNTWDLPFIEKHYREALKTMEEHGQVSICRRESKKSGIKGKDLITFSQKA